MFDTNEIVLTRVVINIRKKPLDISGEYAFMFHGSTHLTPGHYYYCYPSNNISYGRMVNQFRKRYKRNLDFTFAYGGLKEM